MIFAVNQYLTLTNASAAAYVAETAPAKAIEMVEVDGKKRPQLNLSKCVFCYQCAETCPKKAVKNSATYELATTDKSTLIKTPQPNNKT